MTAEVLDPVVYQWDFTERVEDGSREDLLIRGFLAAHDIDPMAFIEGNSLVVRRRDDGSFWLDTWRAVGNDSRTAPVCESCPCCIAQERIVMPLAAPVPLLSRAYVNATSLDLPAKQ